MQATNSNPQTVSGNQNAARQNTFTDYVEANKTGSAAWHAANGRGESDEACNAARTLAEETSLSENAGRRLAGL